ncbi:hypothetical protein [Puia dinghuensis]|uniref:Uncharacterized protein n=1 Tax=Puia dinghuensis TaxID=1792502 RepID=A0A8J2XS68_9BACT|nr:hypothetical protein [Puia dinghuensis]GGA92657.1 hypothetical protein GCM10011511_15060 [Puia dinghuensis]
MENEVKLLGGVCKLVFTYYPNRTVAIIATLISTGEEWCVPTVNYERFYQGYSYRKQLAFPNVVVKNYSENDGVYQQLVDAEVIIPGPYLAGSGGTVIAGTLTEKWQQLAQEQLKKAK